MGRREAAGLCRMDGEVAAPASAAAAAGTSTAVVLAMLMSDNAVSAAHS